MDAAKWKILCRCTEEDQVRSQGERLGYRKVQLMVGDIRLEYTEANLFS